MSNMAEQSREASLEFVANVAEAFHHVKQRVGRCACNCRRCVEGSCACNRCGRCACSACACGPGAGDFLYDYTRLNLSYLNQLVRLGTGYTLAPARLFECLYANLAGPRSCHPTPVDCRPGVYVGKPPEEDEHIKPITPGGHASYQLTLKNPSASVQQVQVLLGSFTDSGGQSASDLNAQLEYRGESHDQSFTKQLDPGVELELLVKVTAGDNLEPDRKFRALAYVTFDKDDTRTANLVLVSQ